MRAVAYNPVEDAARIQLSAVELVRNESIPDGRELARLDG